MSGDWPRLALVVAPVPFPFVSRTADRIATSVLLLVLGLAMTGWIVRDLLDELALDRQCAQPLEVDERVEVNW